MRARSQGVRLSGLHHVLPAALVLLAAAPALATAQERSGPEAFRSSVGITALVPLQDDDPFAFDRLPSVRTSFSFQLTPALGLQLGGLRLAPANATLHAALAGLRLNLSNGRFRLAPFVEGGYGSFEGVVDTAGYYTTDGQGSPVFVSVPWRATGEVLGGGAGIHLEFIIGNGATVVADGAYYTFPGKAFNTHGAFAGVGLRLAFKDERWYWRTGGRDRVAPLFLIVDGVRDSTGMVIHEGEDLRVIVSDPSGIDYVAVNEQPIQLYAVPRALQDLVPGGSHSRLMDLTPLVNQGVDAFTVVAFDGAGNANREQWRLPGSQSGAPVQPTVAQAEQFSRPVIEVTEPAEWAAGEARGLVAVRKRSIEVRGTIRYAGGIGDVRVAGQRASLDLDPSGVLAHFMGFVPVTETIREVVVEARGSDGAYASRVFRVFPSEPTAQATPGDYLAAANNVNRQRWAIIVGVSRYADPNIPDLLYADADARAIYDFLMSPSAGLGGIPRDNIRLLLNENATERNIRTALLTFLRQSTPEDVIFIYLAGHGMPDPERMEDLYLLAHDTDLANLPVTGIPMELVQEAVARAYSYNTIIVTDACHSAGVGAGPARAINMNQINAEFLDRMNASTGGLVAFTASESNQLSQEGQQYGGGHGVFTYYMLEALRGAADEDGDRIVSLGEMMEYTRERVRRETDNAQVPSISLTPYDRFWPMAIVESRP